MQVNVTTSGWYTFIPSQEKLKETIYSLLMQLLALALLYCRCTWLYVPCWFFGSNQQFSNIYNTFYVFLHLCSLFDRHIFQAGNSFFAGLGSFSLNLYLKGTLKICLKHACFEYLIICNIKRMCEILSIWI